MGKLKDFCQKGSSTLTLKNLEGKEGNYPVFGASGFLKNVDFYKQSKPYIAVVKDGAGVGRVMKLPEKSSIIGTMQYILPNEGVNVDWLCYVLEFLNLAKYSVGATIPHIYFKNYCEEEIPEHSEDEQNKIAITLNGLSKDIYLRQQQLSTLDILVKARFVEMFGDPNLHNSKFPTLDGKSLFTFSSGKFLSEEKRRSEGIPVYGGNGIAWYTDTALITFPTLVIGRVGAYCGNIKIVKEPVWITDNAIYIKCFKTKGFLLEFLFHLMEFMNFSKYANFSGQPKITQKPLESENYILPPLALQEEFAAFVEQVEKTKQVIRQSLEKLETLKKSLMQEYFG